MTPHLFIFLSLGQNELKKEVERRKLGKEILDYKKKQEEEKTKRLLEERNREKAEDKAARERVKQQIALVSRQISDDASNADPDAVYHMIS